MTTDLARQQPALALPAAVRVKCPGCAQTHTRANTPGEVVSCPHCSARLRLPAVALPAAVPVQRQAPPPPAQVTLQLSARLVVWPPVCCHCGTKTDGAREVWCVRATGRGFETKGWDVPTCDRCLSLPPAVEAISWSGTIWVFRFERPEYATLFARFNAPKLLGGARGVAPL